MVDKHSSVAARETNYEKIIHNCTARCTVVKFAKRVGFFYILYAVSALLECAVGVQLTVAYELIMRANPPLNV